MNVSSAGVVVRATPSSNRSKKNMIRAFSGALTLLLIIVVLRLALPEISVMVTEIIIKLLTIVNSGLDLATTQTSI